MTVCTKLTVCRPMSTDTHLTREGVSLIKLSSRTGKQAKICTKGQLLLQRPEGFVKTAPSKVKPGHVQRRGGRFLGRKEHRRKRKHLL